MIGWTLLALCAVSGARAAEPLMLTYEDALSRALAQNTDLLRAGEDLRAADGALLAARGTFDPTLGADLSFNSSTGENSSEFGEVYSEFRSLSDSLSLSQFLPTGTTWSVGLNSARNTFRYELQDTGLQFESDAPLYSTRLAATVTQALLEGHRLSYNLSRVRSAKQSRDAADVALNMTRQETLASVASAYWGLVYAHRAVEIAESAVTVAEEEARVVNARVEAGDLAPVEKLRVEASSVQARSALLSARNTEAQAADALLVLVGATPGQGVTPVTAPSNPSAVNLDEDAVVAAALSSSPALEVARLEEAQAEEDLRNARHGRLPQLDASASYGIKGYEASLGASVGEMLSNKLPEWSVGATLSVPLGNRADRGALQSASASAMSARLKREATERAVSQQIRAQVRTLNSAATQVELAEANLRLAEQTLSAERALQEVGRAIQKDVLESIKSVDEAKLALEKARADALQAVVELERLKGTL